MHTLSSYIVVFLGAGLGGVLRHTVNVAALRLGSDFAHSTLAVNVSGRLLWVCWRVGSPTKLIRVRFGGCSSQRAFLVALRHSHHSRWRPRRALCFSFSSSLAFGSFSGSRHNLGYELGE